MPSDPTPLTIPGAASRLTPTQFVFHCIDRVTQEVQRCHEVLPEESLAAVEQATVKALMDGRITWLAQSGEHETLLITCQV